MIGAANPAVSTKIARFRGRSKVFSPPANRKIRNAATKASRVFPAAVAREVAIVAVAAREVAVKLVLRKFAAKAPTQIPGQSRVPQSRSTAIASPVGGQTGLALALRVAKSTRLEYATRVYTPARAELAMSWRVSSMMSEHFHCNTCY
jgi:hypothetical protein